MHEKLPIETVKEGFVRLLPYPKKWEYAQVQTGGGTGEMNKQGEEGWELISNASGWSLFKREKI
jgi:hypothetical protein